MEKINGTIDLIRFYNNENCFAIANAILKGTNEKLIIKGTIPSIRANMEFEAEGERIMNPRYGLEFKIDSFQEHLPTTADGIESYLGSGFIKGIGPSLAHRIVAEFGDDTINIIKTNPDALKKVKGIGKKNISSIVKQIKEKSNIEKIMVFLKTFGISDKFAVAIYHTYGENSIDIVSKDPYRMVEDIDGVGFKRADEIAMKMGVGLYDEKRIRKGIEYVLLQGVEESYTYMPLDILMAKASDPNILGIDKSYLQDIIPKMVRYKEIVNDEGRIYLRRYYEMECNVAQQFAEKSQANMFNETYIEDIDEDTITYSKEQLDGIKLALKSKVTVITGGPGTGKTTILKGLLGLFEKNNYWVHLAAPTGRASKRMSEATGRKAQTIHRLLQWKDGQFTKDEYSPLDGDVLILDECSMINLRLMNALLKAIPNNMKLIMVGDVDQLPSIGCGNVLKDIIDSNVVPVIRLTHIFRQGMESKIISNAHLINNGQMPDISNNKGTDFYFFKVNTIEDIKSQVIRLVTDAIPNKFGFSTDDIQVLTPMKKNTDPIGAIQLNIALQEKVNPLGKALNVGFYKLREGDRVMQNKNDYDLGVFNGDIGKVISVDNENLALTVQYSDDEDSIVTYDSSNLSELELAYATTVHKSQGSEYPVVIFIASRTQYIMLQRQLFYTAVTRAKKLCIVIGGYDAVQIAVNTTPINKTYSFLKNRIIQFSDVYKVKDAELAITK